MKTKRLGLLYLTWLIIFICFYGCTNKKSESQNHLTDTKAAINYLKSLEGKWLATLASNQSKFGWEFDLSAKDVIIERLRTDVPTEMLTVYNLDNGILRADHFCQLQNQPNLIAVASEAEGDIHFLCDEQVGNTASHDELHMHGYHLMKTDSSLIVWMDMYKNGTLDFETRYELFRADSKQGQELTSVE